jgi:hypothetical protein
MKAILGAGLGAFALAGALILFQGRGGASDSAVAGRTVTTSAAAGPTLVSCGDGNQPLVRSLTVGGEPVAHVECVPVAGAAYGLRPASYALDPRAVSPLPVIDEPVAPARVRTVAYERPRAASSAPRRASTTRPWKKSALIIGGSAAGGAGIGALIDGGSGAKKGAVVGGLAGVVYDLATRDGRR